MTLEICNTVWPIYLIFFLYQNYKWMMASGHQFGERDTTNNASSGVIFTALLIVISFSFCQLGLSKIAAMIMAIHLLIHLIRPQLIDRWIKAY